MRPAFLGDQRRVGGHAIDDAPACAFLQFIEIRGVEKEFHASHFSTAGLQARSSTLLHYNRNIVPGKTFYIETFGCQMNAHDSEKVIGTLHARRATRRWRRPKTPDWCSTTPAASATRPSRRSSTACRSSSARRARARSSACSAAWRSRKARRFSTARRTSAWWPGRPAITRLGEMLVQLEAGNRRVTGLSLDTDETFDTPFTRRDNPHRAYITIIEGCDKSLRLLRGAVHARPGAQPHQRERHGRSAPPGGAGLHRNPTAGPERQQLSRPVARRLGFRRRCWRASAEVPGIRRVRFTTSHPRDFVKTDHGRHGRQSGALRPRAPAGAVRIVAGAGGHGAALHARRVHAAHRVDQERRSASTRSPPTSSSASPARPRRISKQTLDLLDEVQYDSLFSFKYSPRPNTAALDNGRPAFPKKKSSAAS